MEQSMAWRHRSGATRHRPGPIWSRCQVFEPATTNCHGSGIGNHTINKIFAGPHPARTGLQADGEPSCVEHRAISAANTRGSCDYPTRWYRRRGFIITLYLRTHGDGNPPQVIIPRELNRRNSRSRDPAASSTFPELIFNRLSTLALLLHEYTYEEMNARKQRCRQRPAMKKSLPPEAGRGFPIFRILQEIERLAGNNHLFCHRRTRRVIFTTTPTTDGKKTRSLLLS